jgi:hypothetical protein
MEDEYGSNTKNREYSNLFQTLPHSVMLQVLQGILFDARSDKPLFEALEVIIKDIRKGNMSEKEKYQNRFGRAIKWAESRLRNEKDPEKLRKLTARRLAHEYAARTGWSQNLLYRLMQKVKQKECMRRLRERRKTEGTKEEEKVNEHG